MLIWPSAVAGSLISLFTLTFFISLLIKTPDDFVLERIEQLEDMHGSAQFNQDDLSKDLGRPKGIYLGAGFYYPHSGHYLTLAGTRGGKGASQIIPTLLQDTFDGSIVVFDPKGENALETAGYRSTISDVHILDPFKILKGRLDIPTSKFNPLDHLNPEMDRFERAVESLAQSIIPSPAGNETDHWSIRSQQILSGLIVQMTTMPKFEERNLATLADWATSLSMKKPIINGIPLVGGMIDNQHPKGMLARQVGNSLYRMFEGGGTTEGRNILSNMEKELLKFTHYEMKEATSYSGFNPNNLIDDKTTLYIVIPSEDISTYYGWVRMVIGACRGAAIRRQSSRRVLFIMDELAQLKKIDYIEKGLPIDAGLGVSYWLIGQDLSDLAYIYGEKKINSFIGNTACKTIFQTADPMTLEKFSKFIGNKTEILIPPDYHNTDSRQRSTTQIQVFGRPLMTSEEIGKFAHVLAIYDTRNPNTRNKKGLIKLEYYFNEPGRFFDEIRSRAGLKRLDDQKPF